MRSVLHVLALAILLLFASPVAAQNARAIADQAQKAFQAGQYENAAVLFEEAWKLDPHPALLFNLARALEELGDFPAALQRFREVVQTTTSPKIRQSAEEKIEQIAATLLDQGYDPLTVTSETYVPRGKLLVVSEPEAEVFLNGRLVGRTPFEQGAIDPGTYELRVSAEGFQPHAQIVDIVGSRSTSVRVTLVARTSLENYVPPQPGRLVIAAPARDMNVYIDGDRVGSTPLDPIALSPGRYLIKVTREGWLDYNGEFVIKAATDTRVQVNAQQLVDADSGEELGTGEVGTFLMIGGAAVVATGAVFGVLALTNDSAYSSRTDAPNRGEFRDSAETQALVADITIGLGVALVATGAVLKWVVDSGPDVDEFEELDRELVFTPGLVPGGAGFVLSGTW